MSKDLAISNELLEILQIKKLEKYQKDIISNLNKSSLTIPYKKETGKEYVKNYQKILEDYGLIDKMLTKTLHEKEQAK